MIEVVEVNTDNFVVIHSKSLQNIYILLLADMSSACPDMTREKFTSQVLDISKESESQIHQLCQLITKNLKRLCVEI